jgi:hypothetical protein
MPRGGRRAGRPGVKYPERTDLRSGPLVPTAPTGLAYGQHQALVDAQRQIPMGPAGAATPAPAAPPPAAPAPPAVLPGSLGAFDRPTDRPGEPVTAGLPTGPGPGPEVLGLGGPMLGKSLADVLSDVASASASPELAQLAQRARALGQ